MSGTDVIRGRLTTRRLKMLDLWFFQNVSDFAARSVGTAWRGVSSENKRGTSRHAHEIACGRVSRGDADGCLRSGSSSGGEQLYWFGRDQRDTADQRASRGSRGLGSHIVPVGDLAHRCGWPRRRSSPPIKRAESMVRFVSRSFRESRNKSIMRQLRPSFRCGRFSARLLRSGASTGAIYILGRPFVARTRSTGTSLTRVERPLPASA